MRERSWADRSSRPAGLAAGSALIAALTIGGKRRPEGG
jgi:hypothetical protein